MASTAMTAPVCVYLAGYKAALVRQFATRSPGKIARVSMDAMPFADRMRLEARIVWPASTMDVHATVNVQIPQDLAPTRVAKVP
jgi:hypothetical protein